MRLLQLSDPHLLADPGGLCRGRRPLLQLRHGLRQAQAAAGGRIDLLLLSGDLCHDESWLGYCQLRDLLHEAGLPAALVPGNHDHPQLLRAALGRRAATAIAPALLPCGAIDLLLLDSHLPGSDAGELGESQLRWLESQLAMRVSRPLLVMLHHPPLAIGDPGFDAIALRDGPRLLELLRPLPALKGVLFGHIHQHWQGLLGGRDPALAPVPLLGCPSTLCSFAAVQACPLDRADDPGARVLSLGADGELQHQLLRWHPSAPPSLAGHRSIAPSGP